MVEKERKFIICMLCSPMTSAVEKATFNILEKKSMVRLFPPFLATQKMAQNILRCVCDSAKIHFQLYTNILYG